MCTLNLGPKIFVLPGAPGGLKTALARILYFYLDSLFLDFQIFFSLLLFSYLRLFFVLLKVGAHHHSSASNVSTGNSSSSTGNADSHILSSLSSDNLAPLKKTQSKDYLSKSSNCVQTCSTVVDQGDVKGKKQISTG